MTDESGKEEEGRRPDGDGKNESHFFYSIDQLHQQMPPPFQIHPEPFIRQPQQSPPFFVDSSLYYEPLTNVFYSTSSFFEPPSMHETFSTPSIEISPSSINNQGVGGDQSTKNTKWPTNDVNDEEIVRVSQSFAVQHSLPVSSRDNHEHIINVLLLYTKDAFDEKFTRAFIKKILKTLKNDPSEIDNLIETITSNGRIIDKCVYLPGNVDGRWQVLLKKIRPEVTSVRIWRLPYIKIGDFNKLPFCIEKKKHICINPFHYENLDAWKIQNKIDRNLAINPRFLDQQPQLAFSPPKRLRISFSETDVDETESREVSDGIKLRDLDTPSAQYGDSSQFDPK